MILNRFEAPGLAHYSYIAACGGNAIVIDPQRDFDVYLDFARARDLRISHILETHIHADYASGASELARVTGAEPWLSKYDAGEDFEYRFPHREFRDGEELRVGTILIRAVHTPGHTPEHLSFLLHDLGRGPHPMALLSGDFLFVGSLGRPDLLGEAAKRRLAEELYTSMTSRIANLPDGLEIFPAHGAGSMCGSGIAAQAQSTLGYERLANVYFGLRDREAFIEKILATVPPFPEYYKRMKRVNSAGAAALGGIPGGAELLPRDVRELVAAQDAVVIDLRRPEAFGGAHIPGAFNVGAGPTFAVWAAWVIPYDRPIVLAGDDSSYERGDYEAARRGLIRVGLDDIRGSLQGGMRAWIDAGFAQAHVAQESVSEAQEGLKRGEFLLDVRSKGEWQGGHAAGAVHVMAGDLQQRLAESPDLVPRDKPVHVVCGSGYRSSIAASILRRAGYSNVSNVAGGMTAWQRAGLPVVSD